MAEQPDKKNILDIFSNRDEKAAIEAAKTRIAELEKQLAEAETLKSSLMRRATDLEGQLAQARAAAAKAPAPAPTESIAMKATLAQLEQRLAVAEQKARLYDEAQSKQAAAASAAASAAAQVMTTHTLTDQETLSDLSLKYYGHATKPYWTLIYEANKAAIGDNPNRVRPGTELKIPVLPADMKK